MAAEAVATSSSAPTSRARMSVRAAVAGATTASSTGTTGTTGRQRLRGPGERGESRADNRGDNGTEGRGERSDNRSDNRSDRSDDRSQSTPDSRNDRADNAAGRQPCRPGDNRTDNRADNRTDSRADNRTDGGSRYDNRGDSRGPRGNDGDDDERGGRRRNRQRSRDRKRGGTRRDGEGFSGGYSNDEPETIRDDDVLIPVAGILDVLDNYAFVRTSGYLPGANDVYVSLGQVKKYDLRKGDAVVGAIRPAARGRAAAGRQKFNALVRIDTVNGTDARGAAGAASSSAS